MGIRHLAAVVIAAAAATAGIAGPAGAAPRALTTYQFDGQVQWAAEPGQCLTAVPHDGGYLLGIFGCSAPETDPEQQWTAITSGTVMLMGLAGVTKSDEWVISGEPGPGGRAVLLNTHGKDAPVAAGIFISGSLKRAGATNGIANVDGGRLSVYKKGGHGVYWASLFNPSYSRGWVFAVPPRGTGWRPVTVQ
jgi:hypothetical protein